MVKLTITRCEGRDDKGDYIVDVALSTNDCRCLKYIYDKLVADEDCDSDRFAFEGESLICKDIEFTTICLITEVLAAELNEQVVINASAVLFEEDMVRIAEFYYKFKGGSEDAF